MSRVFQKYHQQITEFFLFDVPGMLNQHPFFAAGKKVNFMKYPFRQADIVFRNKRAMVAIPNNAIAELSLSALGFYGIILDRVQNSNVEFDSKQELVSKMLSWCPTASLEDAEKAWAELAAKGYIVYSSDEDGETVEITYGPEEKEGEQ